MGTYDSKRKFPILEVAKINLKHNAGLSLLVSAAFMLLVPGIVGTANLDRYAAAGPLEMFVSLIGIVMLTPVFGPEQNAEIDDLVSSKYVSTTKIYLVRTGYSLVILALLIGLFSGYMSLRNCEITLWLIIGTLADAIFLGSLGMIASSICNSTVVAYMIPLVYYTINYGMGSRLRHFWLFSMRTGQFAPKVCMLITGILFVIVSLILKGIRRKIVIKY